MGTESSRLRQLSLSGGMSSSHRYFEGKSHAAIYAAYRPTPPTSLVEKIVNNIRSPANQSMAIDVGCGTGQATLALAQHFDRVVGIDISENQISEAGKSIDGDEKLRETIEFRVGSYMHLKELDSASVDLVTCCQAIHWFDDIPAYYAEVDRVLRPGGVIAVLGYNFHEAVGCAGAEEFNALRKRMFEEEGDFAAKAWDPRARHVFEGEYRTIPQLTYEDKERDDSHFVDIPSMSLKDFLEEQKTSSGFQTYCKENDGEKFIQEFSASAKEILGYDASAKEEDIKMRMKVRYFLLLGRKGQK